MRLTAILLHWKKRPPPGHYWRGKHRKVKDPTYWDLLQLRHDFEREERNMLVLRHPYLTSEQSRGHMKDLRVPPNFKEMLNVRRNEKFQKHFSWSDQLGHLRVTDGWE